MGSTVLLYPAYSRDLEPSDYHLFGSVKDALHECHFAYDNKLKFLVMCFEAEVGNFATLVYSILLNIDKNVLKMTVKL
jgi:hypothetical protein